MLASARRAGRVDAFGSELNRRPNPLLYSTAAPAAAVKRPRTMPNAAGGRKVDGGRCVHRRGGVACVFLIRRSCPRATTGMVTLDTTPSGLGVTLAGKSLERPAHDDAGGRSLRAVGAAPNLRTIKVTVAAGISRAAPEFAEAPVRASGDRRLHVQQNRVTCLFSSMATIGGMSPVSIDRGLASTKCP